MKLRTLTPVIIESPYAGNIPANKEYLQLCIRWCFAHDLAPFASHQMYTEALDDNNPDERRQGMAAGYAWWEFAKEIIFFNDLSYSKGMRKALTRAINPETRKPFRDISLREYPDFAADLDRIISRLPRDTEQGSGKRPRDQSELRNSLTSVQFTDALVRSPARSTT